MHEQYQECMSGERREEASKQGKKRKRGYGEMETGENELLRGRREECRTCRDFAARGC